MRDVRHASGMVRAVQGSILGSTIVVGLIAVALLLQPFSSAERSTYSDGFSRIVEGTWGAARGAGAWEMVHTSDALPNLRVSGGKALYSAPFEGSKSLHLLGPASTDGVTVAATFTVDHQPLAGTSNHWQVIARQSSIRTYYLFRLVPRGSEPAALEIERARAGVFTTLASAPATFIGSTDVAYRIVGRATSSAQGTTLQMRAFPVAAGDPGGWPLSYVDAGPERLTDGRAGVRLSVYEGPARMTVDDVEIRFD